MSIVQQSSTTGTPIWLGMVCRWVLKVLSKTVWLLGYIVNGVWIVDLVRWLIGRAGILSESAFLLAVLYVTFQYVAHPLLIMCLPSSVVLILNEIAVVAFALLPELIIFNAIYQCYDLWSAYLLTKRKSTLLWASAYTLPTSVFLCMTIITITGFVSVEAASDSTLQVTGAMLVIRCLAGWWYATLQRLFAGKGRAGFSSQIRALQQNVDALTASGQQQADRISALERQLSDAEADLQQARLRLASRKILRNVDLVPEEPAREINTGELPALSEKVLAFKEALAEAVKTGDRYNLKQICANSGISYSYGRLYHKQFIGELTSSLPAIQ